ncbi:hypothetical protein VCSRO136_2337 [Vibrio cholerae]|nr:hypothetical protein VCSRO136_2337 [Vibrio cholerae]
MFIYSEWFAIASGILLIIACSVPFIPSTINLLNKMNKEHERVMLCAYSYGIPILLAFSLPHLLNYLFG